MDVGAFVVFLSRTQVENAPSTSPRSASTASTAPTASTASVGINSMAQDATSAASSLVAARHQRVF
jgi:hypothetical protein